MTSSPANPDPTIDPAHLFFSSLQNLDIEAGARAVGTLSVLTDIGLLRDLALEAETKSGSMIRRAREGIDKHTGAVTRKAGELWDRKAHQRIKDLTDRSATMMQDLGSTVGPKVAAQYRRIVPSESLDQQLQAAVQDLESSESADTLRVAIPRLISKRLRIRRPQSPLGPDENWYRSVLTEVAKEFGLNAPGLSDKNLQQQLVQSVVDDALKRFRGEAPDASAAEEEAFLEELERRLKGLGERQQRELANDLGLDDLNRASLHKALREGTLGAGLFAGAHAFGGALFFFATSLLHAIATTLFGITLGFGAYTTLVHWLAIAIGPVGIAAWAGGMEFLRRRFRKRIDRRVVSMVLVQVLAGAETVATP
jgi:hypothetical protein